MDIMDAIYSRRAVKHFDPEHAMPDDVLTKLLEATIQAPTSFNIQHWRFVVIKDPALRQKIRELGNDQAQITDASVLIVMTADIKAWTKDPERYWANAPQEVSDLLVGWMGPFHEGREELQRDEAMRSMGMAMQTLMLAAQAEEYDSCPMIGYDFDAVAPLINLPSDHAIGPLVVLGKKTKDSWPKPGQLPLDEVVIENGFPA
ncbi:MAG: nitroreductase family protein [Planctomycetota bacterium]